jgi:alpha-galactosidase
MPDSRTALDRPELILRDAGGEPVVAGINWGGPYWALDVTREDTLQHVAGIFSDLHRAGYDFFKLDFIYAAAFPGQHANPMSRSDAYRNACLRIRETVGDDTYLLACGAPIIESIGVFDGIRIGPDVGPVWDDGTYAAAHRSMVTAVHRLWLRPAIDPDPDVVFFRDTDLSADTSRHLQDMAHIAGFLGTSDPPRWLRDDQRAALATAVATRPETEQLSRYRWRVGGHEVDFAPVLAAHDREPQWEGVR